MMTRGVSIVLQLSNTSAILGASHLLARMEHSWSEAVCTRASPLSEPLSTPPPLPAVNP